MKGYQVPKIGVHDASVIHRTWAMANSITFDILPVKKLMDRWLEGTKIVIDPFARNSKIGGKYTNDLNPDTQAHYHLLADEFLQKLIKKGVMADAVVFDPPYSPRQIKEVYDGIGRIMTQQDGQKTHAWTKEKDLVDKLLKPNGITICFGWDTIGMGRKRGYILEEILIVSHGAGHNDLLVTVERKPEHQNAKEK